MAFVKSLEPIQKERNTVHGAVRCTYTVFTDASGTRYLQLDTYGSPGRQLKDKISQSVQFDEDSLRELLSIIARECPGLG